MMYICRVRKILNLYYMNLWLRIKNVYFLQTSFHATVIKRTQPPTVFNFYFYLLKSTI